MCGIQRLLQVLTTRSPRFGGLECRAVLTPAILLWNPSGHACRRGSRNFPCCRAPQDWLNEATQCAWLQGDFVEFPAPGAAPAQEKAQKTRCREPLAGNRLHAGSDRTPDPDRFSATLPGSPCYAGDTPTIISGKLKEELASQHLLRLRLHLLEIP